MWEVFWFVCFAFFPPYNRKGVTGIRGIQHVEHQPIKLNLTEPRQDWDQLWQGGVFHWRWRGEKMLEVLLNLTIEKSGKMKRMIMPSTLKELQSASNRSHVN